ncbi:glycoside hydrolase family 15 protein [Candidatus Woesebacteria bacterium]|nr:glycoside hydrolase family 15 protein [Candidatus Woesebacteria bacterium]
MARALTLGNGSLLVCLDKFGFVRDFYFPYVGLENHVAGHKHRIGVRINEHFSWLDDGSWVISLGYKPETMVGYLVCKNEKLQVSIVMEDSVYNESNVFLRQVDVYNHSEQFIDVQVFFHQVFHIGETKKRNTAFFDPTHNAVVHYKGRRVFIVNGRTEQGSSIDDYTVGAYQFEGKEGSYRDAEDGSLSKNAVEHGSVDSVVRFCTSCENKKKTRIYYWISAGKSLDEAYELNDMVLRKTPEGMLHSTESYWTAWLSTRSEETKILKKEHKKLFDTSLFVLRSHFDVGGSVIASADSEMIEYGKDDYSYMWPRDAAFIVESLDQAGYSEITKSFFLFCKDVLHPDGYLHHRFRPDKALGSTWHSATSQREWLKDKILQLPIQEDESAAVIHALWNHYEKTKDLEFIETLYKPLIEKIARFLINFTDAETGLPLPSYDLWEEKIGVSTYTCACVYGGLMAAAKFSELLDKRNHMREFKDAAKKIKQAAIDHLYSPELQSFVRVANFTNGKVVREEIVDASSLFGLWYFDMIPQDDPLFISSHQQMLQRLSSPEKLGGIIRYEKDNYFRSTDKSNPWFITTLWEAQRKLSQKQVTQVELDFALQTFDWVCAFIYPSGVLAEQLNPYTGESLSATPLVWSHAVYIQTVLLYLKKKKDLELEAAGITNPVHEL